MTKTQRILFALFIIGTTGFLAYKWWKSFDLASKFDVAMQGKSFRIFGLHRGKFDIVLNITQKFPFDISATGYNLTVSLNGTPISNLINQSSQVLKSNEVSPLVLVGDFDPAVILKTALNFQALLNIFKAPQLNTVNIKGTININAKGVNIDNIPVDETITLADFLYSGQN